MSIARYNAKDTTVQINGVFLTGFGESMVTWSKNEAYFEPVVGAQGDVVKSEINNSLYTLTLSLQKTSPFYSEMIRLQNSGDMFEVIVSNKALGVTFGGTQASIMEAPEISLGASAEDAEFSICVFDGFTNAN